MRPTAYRRNARGLRDRQAFERIRLQAGALFAAGRSQTEVAHQLGVSRQNTSRWHTHWRAGGQDALRSAGPTRRASRLSDQQLHDLKQALRQGAHVHGFDTDHWTLARIATVIQQMTGIGHHRRARLEAAAPPAGLASAAPRPPRRRTRRASHRAVDGH
jgi:transposase